MHLWEVFERKTWTFARIALSRFRKDRRARRFFGDLGTLVIALLAIPLVALAFAVGMLLNPLTLGYMLIVIGLGFGFGIRHFCAQARRTAGLEAASRATPIDARRSLFRITFWLAVLLRRCASEFALLKEMPPEIEIITRRVLLDRLKAEAVWEDIPPMVRDLMLKPDGHWTPAERAFALDTFEMLTTLRWVLDLDKALWMLELKPRYDYHEANSITRDDEWFRRDLPRAPVEIMAQLNEATGFLNRCWVEAVVRGLMPADDESKLRAEVAVSTLDQDADSKDAVFATGTIRETSDEVLRHCYRRAALRVRTLGYVLAELETDPKQQGLSALKAEFFSPAKL